MRNRFRRLGVFYNSLLYGQGRNGLKVKIWIAKTMSYVSFFKSKFTINCVKKLIIWTIWIDLFQSIGFFNQKHIRFKLTKDKEKSRHQPAQLSTKKRLQLIFFFFKQMWTLDYPLRSRPPICKRLRMHFSLRLLNLCIWSGRLCSHLSYYRGVANRIVS